MLLTYAYRCCYTYNMMKRDPKQQKRFEKLSFLLLLSVEEAEELCNAASKTWDYIAYDCLAADPGRNMKADEVIEVVMDANHITSNNHKLSNRVRTLLDSYDASPIIHKLLKEFVFVYKSYGM